MGGLSWELWELIVANFSFEFNFFRVKIRNDNNF